jgi:hypothetical protein
MRETADELTKSFENLHNSQQGQLLDLEAQGAMVSDLADDIEALMGIEEKSTSQKKLLQDKVETLNDLLPELNLRYDEQSGKLMTTIEDEQGVQKEIETTTGMIRDRIKAVEAEAKAEALRSLKIETYKALYEAGEKAEAIEKDLTAATERHTKAKEELGLAMQHTYDTGDYSREDAARKELDLSTIALEEATTAAEESSAAIQGYKDDLVFYEKELAATSIDMAAIEQIAVDAGLDIPEGVRKGFEQGKYAMIGSGEELSAIMNYEEMTQQAEGVGLMIPEAIATGIAIGDLSPAQAVDAMQGYVSFANLIENSGLSGTAAVQALVDSVNAGQLNPADAIAEMQALVQFNDLVANSGLSGNAAVQAIVDSVNAGQMEPANAMNLVTSMMNSPLSQFPITAKSQTDLAMSNMTGSLSGGGPAVATAAGDVAKGSNTEVSQYASIFGNTGKDLALGTAAGISRGSDVITAMATSAITTALATARRIAGIHSPSTVWRDQLGKQMGVGAAVGLEESIDEITSAAASAVEQANEAAKSALVPLEMPKIDKGAFISSIDTLKKEQLMKSIASLGPKLPKIYAEMEASAMLHFGTLTGGAAANASAWEDPYYNKQVILKADITNTLDGRLLSKASAPYMDVELRRLDSRGERSA